ncbi:uncharacterized protein BP5553_08894 [Venustampulla echinocandica]|uniref:Uncharacterized protein n=1 Tax=Venustampulla echinocandica TaxID=2656787 RepID=A0A370TD88_9HELO|nr:uncharacterized protein BP5553_08894 [Venustampulla echinocandica]RDL32438.1 hypothetical protein BP5553_08894 [Venustampulla echinocandica]
MGEVEGEQSGEGSRGPWLGAPPTEVRIGANNNDLRGRIYACLAQYREKILQYNKTILDREIALQQIDKESSQAGDIASLLDELWGDGDDMEAVQRDVHKVSDLYKHIPDGTMPIKDWLAEHAAQLDAEEPSGRPSVWRNVYNLMRCPDPLCDLEPYCWGDPDRHIVTFLNIFAINLTRRINNGLGGHQRANSAPAANFPRINITNVLPGPPHQASLGSSPALTLVLDMDLLWQLTVSIFPEIEMRWWKSTARGSKSRLRDRPEGRLPKGL